MTASLNLIRLPVDLRALARQAGDRGWVKRRDWRGRETDVDFDEGAALHHVLGETFGPGVLQPFRLKVSPGAARGDIWAYSSQSVEALRETAAIGVSVLDAGQIQAKQMPTDWREGRRVGFDISVRPIVRIKSTLHNPRKPERPYRPGAELDAYFVEAARAFPGEPPRLSDDVFVSSGMERAGRTRETVYREWLAARFLSDGAASATIETAQMTHFRRRKLVRGRASSEGPVAILQGDLVIQDGAAFADLLARGVGRHKAYGFGMLLLRPTKRQSSLPQDAPC